MHIKRMLTYIKETIYHILIFIFCLIKMQVYSKIENLYYSKVIH
jgi:hypothetical protein